MRHFWLTVSGLKSRFFEALTKKLNKLRQFFNAHRKEFLGIVALIIIFGYIWKSVCFILLDLLFSLGKNGRKYKIIALMDYTVLL